MKLTHEQIISAANGIVRTEQTGYTMLCKNPFDVLDN